MLDKLPEAIEIGPTVRDACRMKVERRCGAHQAAKVAAADLVERTMTTDILTVAVATKGDGIIDQHFGHAREFQIYGADHAGVRFLGVRKLDDHYCQGGAGDASAFAAIVDMLGDVDVLLCARIGEGPRARLTKAGIEASDEFAFELIEPSIAALFARRCGDAPKVA